MSRELGREILKSKGKFPDFNIMDYDGSLRKNLDYYRLEVDDKQKKDWAIKYWTNLKKDVSGISQLSDGYFSTVGAVAHLISRGVDLDAKHSCFIDKKYNELLLATPKEVKEKVVQSEEEKLAAIERQERPHFSEFDNAVDGFFTGTQFDAKGYLIKNGVKLYMSDKISQYIKQRYLLEANEALLDRDPYVRESYSHLTRRQLSKYIDHLKGLIAACEVANAIVKSSRKPRAKKVKPASEIVKAVKFLNEDSTSKLKSIEPAKVVNSTEVWLYNAKNRRLFRCVALPEMKLTVKGSTIQNMDAEKSSGKIIRKPEVLLLGIQTMNSKQLNKLYNEIRGTPSKCSGRLNEEVLIVKCI